MGYLEKPKPYWGWGGGRNSHRTTSKNIMILETHGEIAILATPLSENETMTSRSAIKNDLFADQHH